MGLAIAATAGMQAWGLNPALPPGANFDLSHWYLGLPVDEFGGPLGGSLSIPAASLVAGYEEPDFFYTDTDGSMVFWAPVWGATTPGSDFPRSELREQIVPGNNNSNWNGYGFHILSAECKVTQLPSSGNVIIGQIHSKTGLARPLVKIYYDGTLGRVRVGVKQDADDPENNNDDTYYFPYVGLNSNINYMIEMHDGFLTMTVNGTTHTRDVFDVSPSWQDEEFYFKAGSYCQDNTGGPGEGARVAFYSLIASHGGTGIPSLTVASPMGTPVPPVGTASYAYNTVINASVPDSPIVSGTTRELAAGWTGTGDVVAGSGDSTSFTLTQDSTLTWQWQEQYFLDTDVTGNGQIQAGGSVFDETWIGAGSNVTLTAVPFFGHQFVNWSGDIYSTDPVINVTMDEAKSVTANFGTPVNLTVSSPYGSPIPGVGNAPHAAGSVANASMAGSPVVLGTTRHLVAGWTGTGDVVAGSGDSTSFAVNQDSSITWLWKTQYGLDTEVSGNGSVNVADAWFDAGTNIIITATPDVDHHFVSWSGDSSSTNPILTLTMDAAKSVTAIFAADSSPEVFIPLPEFGGGGVLFTVPSEPGTLYQLEYTDALSTNSMTPVSWENIDGPLSGDGGDLILTDPGPLTSNRFYRLFIQYN